MSLFLGTGCGRSGTLWTAQFFTELGFPTLHEQQFGPERLRAFTTSEVSWLAIPHLSSLPDGTKLLRIVRDPYAVVMSGMQMDFQRRRRGSTFDSYLAEHRPDIVEPEDKLTRIIRWACMWDEPMNEVPHRVLRPDVDPLDRLGEVVEYATGAVAGYGHVARVCTKLGNAVNTKTRTVPIDRAMIDAHPEGWRVKERAGRFGYV